MEKGLNNVGRIHNCFGCGVCAAACKHNVISIILNKDGFYEPNIENADACTNCGICLDVCAFKHDDLANNNSIISVYGSWSKDEDVRRKCSSGGTGFEIARTLMEQGYKACGVRYNADKNRAEHFIANSIKDYIPSIGSKYIQSYTLEAFSSIDLKEKYVVTGTPCQIDSFRRYIRKFRKEGNFVLVDFFCHGVPSKFIWDGYLAKAEKKVGKIVYVAWRHKSTGWHDSWQICIDGDKYGEPVNWHDSYNLLIREKKSFLNSKLSSGDAFYESFLSDSCLNKACYDNCKYKYQRSSADIRIGDMWGSRYSSDEKGVTAAISFTQKGEDLLKQSNCQLELSTIEIAGESQMKSPSKRTIIYYPLRFLIRKKVPFTISYNLLVRPYRFAIRIPNAPNKLKRIIKSMLKK